MKSLQNLPKRYIYPIIILFTVFLVCIFAYASKGQVLGLSFGGVNLGGSNTWGLNPQNTQPTEKEKPSIFSNHLQPIRTPPVRVYTESHSIDLPLINVGVDAQRALEAPKNWLVGGWYHRSSKPGEIGNIVINAHYDDEYGNPAAFYRLNNLQIGDKVFLVDEYDRKYAYSVTDVFYIDIQDPNRLKIFDETDENSELTLITCGGIWIPGKGYNQRLVVKGVLVN